MTSTIKQNKTYIHDAISGFDKCQVKNPINLTDEQLRSERLNLRYGTGSIDDEPLIASSSSE